ncbi:MAG TPA: pirin family protein [Polyangiaceae bacterium]|nr:pirin family protein [Polyangiaceae bacterium]
MLNHGAVADLTPSDRRIVHRTHGHTHGPITRLMSPGDLGELVRPFVFLDHFVFDGGAEGGVVHPHSGIATHTTLLEGSLVYGDSTGKSGTLHPGSLEWMRAGGGVWHGGTVRPGQRLRGFQLWVALAPPFELAPAESHYVEAARVPGDERVRVLLGSYGSSRSPIPYPADVTYLHVRLNEGERWTFSPPARHDVAWLAVSEGTLLAAGAPLTREMAVFEPGNAPITVTAEGSADFVIASAVKHEHPLVLGQYSVHSSRENLARGEAGIREVAAGMSLVPWRPLSASPQHV